MVVSVQQAIARGRQIIELPPRYIQAGTAIVLIVLMIFYFSWWWLALIPFCVLLCTLYAMWATPYWRLWAYENVNDIHQLERSAELYGFIAPGQHTSIGIFATSQQKEQLKELQQRFDTNAVFIDDPSIPAETVVYHKGVIGNNTPLFTLSPRGIALRDGTLYSWSEITNERIVHTTYQRHSSGLGYGGAGSMDLVRLESPNGRIEFNCSSLRISKWKLDLLFYIYRGRKEGKNYK